MKSSFFLRSLIIVFCIIIFSGVLLTRLFWVQVVHGDYYAGEADRQYVTPASDIYERGTIYFQRRDGELISAATQVAGFKLAINPSKLEDVVGTYEKINTLLPLEREDFLSKAEKKDDPYEEVAKRLVQAEAEAISALKIPGVSLFKEKWRFYPGENLAAHTLGFVGYQGDELGGRYGLERQYDALLARGENKPYVNFFAEVFSNIQESFSENEQAGDIITTIEPQVQSFLQTKLSEVRERYAADSIGGIIMNPKDGSIYALGVLPDFNPNTFSTAKDNLIFSNPLVENVLEFGSVVKPLVMAGALDAGVVTPETTYTDNGSVWVEQKEIFNFDKRARGAGITMQEVLNQSLNTGMVFVEQKLGKEKMREYLLGYGIKEKTGIDLPNETGGLVSGIITSPREIEYANAAFGQGIAFTPIAIIRALASLSNGGQLVVPHVVDEIKYKDGTEKKMAYPLAPAKITPATSEEITRMLVTVMDKGISKKLEHWSIAAKTGTAQVADNVQGGYYTDRHTHSFFGYFPAYDPEFIIFLYAVNPKGVSYAVTTWGEPFLELTKFLLNYYDIPPDR